jgi:hypothetical protein
MELITYEQQLLILKKIILDGLSYYLVWRSLDKEYKESNENPKERYGFWWQYRGFLAPARNALLWSTMLQLSKAYDKDERTVSLNNLIANARNNPTSAPFANPEKLEDIQTRIGRNRVLLEKLRRYRNKRLVHYDSTELEDVQIPSEDVVALVGETTSIFNDLKYAYEGKYDDFDGIMADVIKHTARVKNIIKKAQSPS